MQRRRLALREKACAACSYASNVMRAQISTKRFRAQHVGAKRSGSAAHTLVRTPTHLQSQPRCRRERGHRRCRSDGTGSPREREPKKM
eukprot:5608361-Pleurochrysis_carterae.AAC.3